MAYLLFVFLPAFLFSGLASMMVKWAFSKYSQVASTQGFTGAEAAQRLLDRAGISDVEIVPVDGYLTDHYNPLNKHLALSSEVYSSTSIAAIGVATHEAGHAIQHATGYGPLWLRSALVPTANLGSGIGYMVMIVGAALNHPSTILLGAVLFSAVLLFQLVTLPVEFNASNRAKQLVVEAGIVSREERAGIDAVLNAAALTYVAAAVSTLLTLVYYLWRAGMFNSSRDE